MWGRLNICTHFIRYVAFWPWILHIHYEDASTTSLGVDTLTIIWTFNLKTKFQWWSTVWNSGAKNVTSMWLHGTMVNLILTQTVYHYVEDASITLPGDDAQKQLLLYSYSIQERGREEASYIACTYTCYRAYHVRSRYVWRLTCYYRTSVEALMWFRCSFILLIFSKFSSGFKQLIVCNQVGIVFP